MDVSKIKRATARVYKWEMITIHFEQEGKSFAKRQPYHDVFYYTLNHLKKYGFEWGLNPTYEKHYKALSQYHRRAIDKKKNLIVDFEINARGITIEITHEKNLHGECSTGHWDSGHDRYIPLTYVEKKEIELTNLRIQRIIKDRFCINTILDFDDKKSAIQKILEIEAANPHLHGGAKTLQDIAAYVERDRMYGKEKGWATNSNYIDANGKEIKCGEIKYFYSYKHGYRLVRGKVWHNINNMWWVLSNGTLSNVASFNLMDFDPSMIGRRQLRRNEQVGRLNKEISKNIELKNFIKCARLQRQVELLECH